MAIRRITILEDDLDGSDADETVMFALDGTAYEIDLTDKHASDLRSALRPYVEAGRKVSSSRIKGRSTRSGKVPSSAQVRAWADGLGLPVNARGKIRADILEKYQATH
jgi:hypothetical protein